MNVPIGAEVSTTDRERIGETWVLVVDPVGRRLTHVAVREWGAPVRCWLVPVTAVSGTGPGGVRLACDRQALHRQRPFRQADFVELDDPSLFPYEPAVAWPYATTTTASRTRVLQRVPKWRLPTRRGAEVSASDGVRVGRVDEFLVDTDGWITHLVLRERHRAEGQLIVPLSAVACPGTRQVRLRVGADEVARLPAPEIRRATRPRPSLDDEEAPEPRETVRQA